MEPLRLFGLHFAPGVAQYTPPSGDPFLVYIDEKVAKEMDKSFEGRAVFVKHATKPVDYNDKNSIDGYVVKSFYNEFDGKHWAEFIITSDQAYDAIMSKGWKLSNAYFPEEYGPAGMWHGLNFNKEVKVGKYDHLAIVDNPRYAESIVLTPEQFKSYNEQKASELKKLQNSKDSDKREIKKMKFNIFKREKIENSIDLAGMAVTLPSTKRDVTLENAIEMADKLENMHGYASDDHMVKVNDKEEMSVKELRDCYGKMKNDEMERLKKEEAGAAAKPEKKDDNDTFANKDPGGEPKVEKPGVEDKQMNPGDKEKTQNSVEAARLAVLEAQKNFEKLANARDNASKQEAPTLDNEAAMVSRGQARYGTK